MQIILGILLFLIGVKILSAEMKSTYSFNIKTNNILLLLVYGIISTTLLQSSSIIICLVMVFVHSKKLTLNQGIFIVMGANIGTTSTALITSFSYDFKVLLAIFIISFIILKRIRISTSIVMFLMGLNFIKGSNSDMYHLIEPIINKNNNFTISLMIMLLTSMIQSSSLVITFLQTFYEIGAIKYELVLYVLVGVNIGTTSTAILCSIALNEEARKLTYFHLVFNVLSSVVILIIFYTTGITIGGTLPGKYLIFLNHLYINVIGTLLISCIYLVRRRTSRN